MLKGIIIKSISGKYFVEDNLTNKIYECSAKGKLKKEEINPVVGDIVEFEIIDEEKQEAIVVNILERKTYLKRPKLSNLTQIIFVVSMKSPKPDLLMLDKQLAFAEYLRLKTIIVLNKIDLDNSNEISELYSNLGYTVIQTNAKQKQGIDKLKELLKNEISAFSGNSGVGKSTLINSILEENITQEGVISNKNQKGKNTTTAITLYKIENNSYIADTPGFSTFDIYEIESRNLAEYFPDLLKHIKDCEFGGCAHIKEENCGIKKAVQDKKISEQRYERYCKIYEDIKDKEEHKW